MKNIARNLLEMALNCEDIILRFNLEEVRNLLDEISCTINWRSIKKELMKEYANDYDALEIIRY